MTASTPKLRKVKTLNATVEHRHLGGRAKKGMVTDYQQIRGYILIRRPNMIRMIGLFPRCGTRPSTW